jgi:hypothetical protein
VAYVFSTLWDWAVMITKFGRTDTPRWYLPLCGTFAAIGWLPLCLITPPIHGGSVLGIAFASTAFVIAGYCALELVRYGSHFWQRVLAGVGLFVYGSGLSILLYYAIPRLLNSD